MGSRHFPRYKQLRSAIEARIRDGTYASGQQIPSTSALMKLHGVSDGTVKRAIRELTRDGLIFAINGKGTFVSKSTPPALKSAQEGVGLLHDPRQSEFLGSMYYAPVLRGIEEELTRHGLRLELINAALLSVPELSSARRHSAFRALIVATHLGAEEMTELAATGTATVALFFEYAPSGHLHCLVNDDLAGVRSAAAHLQEGGSRRMGALLSREDHGFRASRLNAFQDVCRELYGSWDDSFVAYATRTSREGGYDAARELLARHPEVDALIAASSFMAVGAIDAAGELGLKIPDDLRVIGYDDLGFAHRVSPTLSVLRSDGRHLGHRAVQILLEELRQPGSGFTIERLQPQLVISDSTSLT